VYNARVNPPNSFETARLILRKPRPEDAAIIFDTYAQDPEVSRYLTFRPHREVRETEEAVARFLEGWRTGKSFCWTIVRRDTGKIIGSLAAREEQGINLGYLLARSFWGQGYMSEALGAVVDWALAQPPVFRVWAVCDTENRASARLLTQCGFRLEGLLRNWSPHPNVSDTPRDCYCYARIRRAI
jgi:ribosomal-protein-alanine N-acetyltransferase